MILLILFLRHCVKMIPIILSLILIILFLWNCFKIIQ